MTRIETTSVRKLLIAGLLAGAVGIAVAKISGMDMPPVPPGAVLLVVAAALVAILRDRLWPVVVAILIGLAEAVPSAISLGDVDGAGETIGTIVRLAGALTALGAGLVLAAQGRGRLPADSPARS